MGVKASRWLIGAALIGGIAPAAAQTVPADTQPAAAASLGSTPAVAPQDTAAPVVTVMPAGPQITYPRPRPATDPAQQPLPVVTTLPQAIALAYHSNPRILSARALVKSADFGFPAARSAYGPSLTATATYTFAKDREEYLPDNFFVNQGWASAASLVLTQPVFTFGRRNAAERGAVATIAFQRDSLRLVEAQELLGVVTAYVNVLRDAAAVTIARENLALLERQYGDSQERFRVREITSTDLQQVQTRVEFGRAQLLAAQGQLGVSQGQFVQYVGGAPGTLAAPQGVDVRFGSLAAAYAFGDQNSPIVRAAQSREKISRANLEAARAEVRPRIDLRGTADYGTVSPYTDDLRATRVTGQAILTQPIFDSGLRAARIGEAREANESDWRLIDTASRETRQAIGAAWNQLTALRTSLDNYRAAVDAAQRAYDGALIQEKAGARTTLDVLDLARDLLTVRTSYNTALAGEYIARANLLLAAGQLEAPLLVDGIDAYDPEDHFHDVARRGDVPGLTPVLSALDGSLNRDTDTDRPLRDTGANAAADGQLPLPPAPVTMP